jgi:hypothetical protein
LLGVEPDAKEDTVPRAEDESFWNQPLAGDFESYIDDDEIKPEMNDVIDGQEELSIVNLEDDN